MALSQETLQRIAREVWAADVAPEVIAEALGWLTPALDGLAALDALDLEPVEPGTIFSPAAE